RHRDEFPDEAVPLRLGQHAFEPGKLRLTEHRARRVVGARTRVAGATRQCQLDVAIRAVVDIDEDRVGAPALGEIELPGTVAAAIARRRDPPLPYGLEIAIGLHQRREAPRTVAGL